MTNEKEEIIIGVDKPQEEPKKNLGGRPRKYPPGYKGPRGANVRLDQEQLDAMMFQRLLKAQDSAMSVIEGAFLNCQNPLQLVQAMIGLRDLMEKIGGGKDTRKKNEIAKALKVGSETWSREKALKIAAGLNTASDIAATLAQKPVDAGENKSK